MDFCSYRGLPMTVLQSTVHERTPQHDRSHSTYECTKWLVSFLVTFGQQAVSFNPAAGGISPVRTAPLTGSWPQPPPFPVTPVSKGSLPVKTDNAIRAFLEYPRGTLIVRSNSNVGLTPEQLTDPTQDPGSLVFVAPSLDPARNVGPTYTTDVRNGPFCKVNSIQFIPGEALWKIHLTFEAYVYESQTTGAYNVILSNRWTVTSDINWQHVTTRTYQGICTVRGDLLRTANGGPVGAPAGFQKNLIDSIRSAFASFTVPLGFERTMVRVQLTPDGNNAVYVVRDEQQLYNKQGTVIPSIPRVEINDTSWTHHGSWGRAAVRSMPGPVELGIMAAVATIPGIGIPAVIAWGSARGLDAIIAGSQELPKYSRTVVVRAWGNTTVNRRGLINVALALAISRIGSPAILDVSTTELIVSGDSNNMVTIVWTVKWGHDAAYGAFGNIALAGLRTFAPGVSDAPGGTSWMASLTNNLEIPAFITQTPVINPPFPNQRGTAGTAQGNGIAPLITQVLEGFQGVVQSPP